MYITMLKILLCREKEGNDGGSEVSGSKKETLFYCFGCTDVFLLVFCFSAVKKVATCILLKSPAI